MKKYYYLICAALCILSACTTQRDWTVRDTSTMQVNKAGIYTEPQIADLKIDNFKSTGMVSGDAAKETIQSLKDKAIEDALNLANADILVEPSFEVSKSNRSLSVKVTGFAARITAFRVVAPGDNTALRADQMYIGPTVVSATSAVAQADNNELAKKRKKRGRAIAAGVSLGILIPLALGLGLGLGLQ